MLHYFYRNPAHPSPATHVRRSTTMDTCDSDGARLQSSRLLPFFSSVRAPAKYHIIAFYSLLLLFFFFSSAAVAPPGFVGSQVGGCPEPNKDGRIQGSDAAVSEYQKNEAAVVES